MQQPRLERWISPFGENSKSDERKARLVGELGRPPGDWGDGGCKRRDEERGRSGRGSGRVEKARKREGRGGSQTQKRKGKEEEEKETKGGPSKDQAVLGQEAASGHLRRHRSRSRRQHQKAGAQAGKESKEVPEEVKEEGKLLELIKRQRDDVFIIGGRDRAFRGRSCGPKDLEEGPRGSSVCHNARSPTDPFDSRRHPAGCVEGSHPTIDDAVLQDSASGIYEPCDSKRVATLELADRPPHERRGCERSRPGMPEIKGFGMLQQGHQPRRVQNAGASASREGRIGHSRRSRCSREGGIRRRQDQQKDSVWRQRSRWAKFLGWRKKQERKERRWQTAEGQRRQQGRPKRKGRQVKGLLAGEKLRRAKRRKLEKGSKDEMKISPQLGGMSGDIDSSQAWGEAERMMEGLPVATGASCNHLGDVSKQTTDPGEINSLETFAGVLEWTWEVFKDVRGKMRVQSTTAMEDLFQSTSLSEIFPLPTSPGNSNETKHFSYVVGAINDLAGFSPQDSEGETSDLRDEIKKEVERVVRRFDIWHTPKPEMSFQKLFTVKSIDYKGEEVRIAQPLVWKAVEASLPEGVGSLPLQDYCRLGTLEYVLNFEKYLLPEDGLKAPRPPKVQVDPNSWDDICKGLVAKNICEIWPVDSLYHLGNAPLLNGLFAVGKGEYIGDTETQRLIMNLTPVNSLCRSLSGDVGTLPGLTGFSGFTLSEGEVGLVSSEDIRCFFYLFSIPTEWKRFMGFNKLVSEHLLPPHLRGRDCVLVSRVLPMGFVNSVSIAQHVHRNIVRWSATSCDPPVGGEGELRKDKGLPSNSSLYRVYLDNFDLVERCDSATASQIKGTASAQVLQLRQDYQTMGLPRHHKKAVERQFKAEVQGALFNGQEGFAMAKPGKIWQYSLLGIELLKRGKATLKELQVVCGGFVYIAMFRRALLGALNSVWQFMQKLVDKPDKRPQSIPLAVKGELARFILLMPLAQMEFRAALCEQVTCSDASGLGGGICVSEGLTAYGVAAANSKVRGDLPETHDLNQVLTIGLFDGIGALRLAADTLGLPVAGHVSVELDQKGRRVVESWFPDTTFFEDVREFGKEQIAELALRFSNVALVILGAGPPCQGVSGLNFDKKGALRDHRSSLFQEVPRVEQLLREAFPWAQVHRLMESVASMSDEDRTIMSEGVGGQPYRIDSYGLTLCHRPRLYWPTWELQSEAQATVSPPVVEGPEGLGMVAFFGEPQQEHFLEPGWHLADQKGLPTFTTSRPSQVPGRKPAGYQQCKPHELERWSEDWHRFPPYQYRDEAGLVNKAGKWRRPNVREREVLMGFPLEYTAPCVVKGARKGEDYEDARLTLIGNSWQVSVIVWLLCQLCAPLGLCEALTVQEIIQALTPGMGGRLQTLLLRPPLHRPGSVKSKSSQSLLKKMLGLISVKGEDLLLQAHSETLVRFHRLRASIPPKLWKWQIVAGWKWRTSGDHINVLELRAILTTLRWWVKKRRCRSSRLLHLTDSLVCLHALTRGRSSSRKLRRTLTKINALILAANLYPLWGYVHTSVNPADRPSRRPYRRKWGR